MYYVRKAYFRFRFCSAKSQRRALTNFKPKTKPLSRPIWAKDCEASSCAAAAASSSRWYLNYLEQVAPKTIQFGRISRDAAAAAAARLSLGPFT